MIQTKDSNPAPKSVDANFEMSYYGYGRIHILLQV